MRGRSPLFDSTDVQDCVLQVDVLPTKVDQFRGPQTVPKGQQDHCRVTMAPTVVLGGLNQPLDLALSEVLVRQAALKTKAKLARRSENRHMDPPGTP